MNQVKAPGGGLTARALKLIAAAAMVLDHTAVLASPVYTSQLGTVLHFIGRITGPLMFFFVVEGVRHTGRPGRYALRLGLFALVSWAPYYYYREGRLPGPDGFIPVGAVYTLLLGFLLLQALHITRSLPLRAAVVAGAFALSALGDWAFYGIAYMLLFDSFYHNRRMRFLAGCAVVFISVLDAGFSYGAAGMAPPVVLSIICIQLGQIIPLGLIQLYNGRLGKGGRLVKLGFYIFYPLHLAVLGIARFGWPRLQ